MALESGLPLGDGVTTMSTFRQVSPAGRLGDRWKCLCDYILDT